MDTIAFTPAHVLASAICERRLSPVELVKLYLSRIARHNPALNAVVTLTADTALVRAQAADAALARGGSWGPLHGVPITLEDCHATAGVRSTWGSFPPLRDHFPAAAIRRTTGGVWTTRDRLSRPAAWALSAQ
jgi:amidase